mmetsp:Transcript_5690/g.15309  ORF Transcript_5690/g.15309 Transcript_5690/m.15309 type:complete len:271 (-) Transcript_5690:262-1074(-)
MTSAPGFPTTRSTPSTDRITATTVTTARGRRSAWSTPWRTCFCSPGTPVPCSGPSSRPSRTLPTTTASAAAASRARASWSTAAKTTAAATAYSPRLSATTRRPALESLPFLPPSRLPPPPRSPLPPWSGTLRWPRLWLERRSRLSLPWALRAPALTPSTQSSPRVSPSLPSTPTARTPGSPSACPRCHPRARRPSSATPRRPLATSAATAGPTSRRLTSPSTTTRRASARRLPARRPPSGKGARVPPPVSSARLRVPPRAWANGTSPRLT